MRVYRIESSETDHICGETLIHALQEYFSQTGSDLYEYSPSDKISELLKGDWHCVKFTDEDEGEMTIKDYMENNPIAGLICSTAE